MLKKEGKINDAIIENMLSWHHSGFNVYIGDRITTSDSTSLGNLARYIMLWPCPAGAIFQVIDDLSIICYTLACKKEVLIHHYPLKQ